MKKKVFNIGISCIGSGVGQSVINSLRLSQLPLKTIGFGTNPFAFGAYDCDHSDSLPSIYEKGYVDQLIAKCKEHAIDLLIPGLDDEVFLCAQNEEKLKAAGIKAIFSQEKLVSLCRDKERMSNELNKLVDVFVKTYSKETLAQDLKRKLVRFPLIAKPRSGSASRGVVIVRNEEDLQEVADDCIFQELAVPQREDCHYNSYLKQIEKKRNLQVSEISIQVVFNADGQLLGRMFSCNKLSNGVPIEIIPCENAYVWEIIDRLMPFFLKLGLKGPLNIQGRLTDQGLKIFEMNPRFTGITGLRALMGFNEVEACVKEWLGIDVGKNVLSLNYGRFGTRQTADKSVAIERNAQVAACAAKLNSGVLKRKKMLLVTGATGYLGQSLVRALINASFFEICLLDRNKAAAKAMFGKDILAYYDYDDLWGGLIQLGHVDVLLHLGFARPYRGNEATAQSLKFTQELFTKACLHHVPAIVNLSSQSVYGLDTQPLWSEETPVAPVSPYAQAKYASELILKSLKSLHCQTSISSLRLGSLSGGTAGLLEIDFLSRIVKQAMQGKTINIIDGSQQMEILDVRDAVRAIVMMLPTDSRSWKTIYNLGSGRQYALIDIARQVVDVVAQFNGGIRAEINIEKKSVQMKMGMDHRLFCKDFSWQPEHDLKSTIISLATFLKKKEDSFAE